MQIRAIPSLSRKFPRLSDSIAPRINSPAELLIPPTPGSAKPSSILRARPISLSGQSRPRYRNCPKRRKVGGKSAKKIHQAWPSQAPPIMNRALVHWLKHIEKKMAVFEAEGVGWTLSVMDGGVWFDGSRAVSDVGVYSFVSRRVTVGTPPSLERPSRTGISRMKRYPISSPPSCLTSFPAAAAEPPVNAGLA